MAKTFYTSGTGSQQTLTGSQNEKVAVYQTLADAEADLANLEAGQIVATPDTGDENAQPVDVVQAGNMHAVTSNAVATSNAMPVDEVTLNNVHSVTSNAVAKALSYDSSQEVFIGYYDGEPLYRKLVTVSGSSLPAVGNTVVIDLPSEYSNRAVIFIHANMVRSNFENNIPLGKYFNVFLENRTKLDIEQNATSNQAQYTALIWLDYVYLS